jgi:hypothetical protein
MRNVFTRSEPEFPGSVPNNQPPRPSVIDVEDDTLKRYRSRSRVDRSNASNAAPQDEDPRGYPIPGRSNVPISNGYEYGKGPPPIGSDIPVGSYPTRRPTMSGASGGDERRRSMYAPNTNYGTGDGGTDGYGSFANGNGAGFAPPPQQSYGSSVQH